MGVIRTEEDMPKDNIGRASTGDITRPSQIGEGEEFGSIRQYVGSGRVSSIDGKAYIIHPGDESRTLLTIGTEVRIGDVITAEGHEPVHIRFDDNKSLSVSIDDNAMVIDNALQTPLIIDSLLPAHSMPAPSESSSSVSLPPPSSVTATVSVSAPTPPASFVITALEAPAPTLPSVVIAAEAVSVATVTLLDHVDTISILHPYDPLSSATADALRYNPVFSSVGTDVYSHDPYVSVYDTGPVNIVETGISEAVFYPSETAAVRYAPSAPALSLGFSFADAYNTPLFSDSGIGLREFSSATVIGMFTPLNAKGDIVYQLVAEGKEIIPTNKDDGSFDVGKISESAFSIDALTGILTVNDPLALSHFANPGGLRLEVTATDAKGHTVIYDVSLAIQNYLGDSRPLVATTGSLLTGTDHAEIFYASGDKAAINIGPGDIGLTGASDNIVNTIGADFKYLDAGAGSDILGMALGKSSDKGFMIDFTDKTTGLANNIEFIEFGKDSCEVKLGIAEVFAMTGEGHRLEIFATEKTFGDIVDVNTNGFKGEIDKGAGTETYTGIYNGAAVTLVIDIVNNGTIPITVKEFAAA
jgi:hypothetical protein